MKTFIRRLSSSSTTSEPPSDDELLGALSGVLGADRGKARALLERARSRLEGSARVELREALKRIRSATPAAAAVTKSRTRAARFVPHALPALRPDEPTRIRLPSGRTLRVQMGPATARRDDLVALGRVVAANDRKGFAALARHDRAIDHLVRSQAALAKKLAELEEQGDVALIGLLDGLAGLERRVRSSQRQHAQAVSSERQAVRNLSRRQRALRARVSAQVSSAQIQKVSDAVNSMQVAAFGKKGALLATDNLILAGNQLFWSFLEPLLRGFGLHAGPLVKLAPLGSLAVSALVLGPRQIPAKGPVVG